MNAQLSFLDAVNERDRILAAMAANHRVYLESLRAFAREIALRTGEVSIDDVRTEIERRSFPMPKDIGSDERLFGSLFKTKEFRPIGRRRTTRDAWAARVGHNRDAVTVYALAEAAA